MNFIKNPKILREWSHLSLEQRAALLREKYGLKSLHATTLWKYYHDEKVTYRKPQFSYGTKEKNQRAILEHQQEFSRTLTTMMIRQEHEIVYIDETTFNLWQQPTRCWLRKNMTLNLSTVRGKSISLLGALSEQRGLFYTELLDESNTAKTFARFIAALKRRQVRKTVVVMDNLSVHKSKIVTQLFDPHF